MIADTKTAEFLGELVTEALDDLRAVNPVVLDVRGRTSITDLMVVATGTSNRHVKSLADHVIEKAKEAGVRPLGVEGAQGAEWILVDLGDGVVHVMAEETRDRYRLEQSWGVDDEDAD
jgi:ribosome-associated protein